MPIFQTLSWMRTPMQFMEECQARHGDFFTIRFAGLHRAIVIVADPTAIREVFASDHDAMHAGEANIFLGPFLGKHSLILLDGKPHARHRKLLMPPFHGERMQAYGREMIARTEAVIDDFPVGAPFPLHPSCRDVTLQIILRTVFGMEDEHERITLSQLLGEALDIVEDPVLLMPFFQVDLGRLTKWGRYRHLAGQVDALLLGQIERRRSQGTKGRSDILSMLLDARDENGAPMSDEELRDELITLLVAGHETTATALAWTFRWLLERRDVMTRLRAEAIENDAIGVPERIAKLDLLDATIKEALRLQPIIPLVGRVLKEPLTLGGFELPVDTMVAPSIYLVHRRPGLYPQPRTFDPDRFLAFRPSPTEFFPFGGGIRKCIGMSFALYEMKMVLTTILARTEMRLAPGASVKVKRRAITLAPPEGLPVVVTSKRTTHPRAA